MYMYLHTTVKLKLFVHSVKQSQRYLAREMNNLIRKQKVQPTLSKLYGTPVRHANCKMLNANC